MAAYDKCANCECSGEVACTRCICQQCSGSSAILGKCPTCVDGTLSCPLCKGTGQIVIKKGWFSDKYGPHNLCEGTGRYTCVKCKGQLKALITCPACTAGRVSPCAQCNNSRKVKCNVCNGNKRVESAWTKSLKALPIDRLQFERQKRESLIQRSWSQITAAQAEVSRLYRRAEQIDREAERMTSVSYEPDWDMVPDSGPTYAHISDLQEKINELESNNKELETQIKLIERALESKYA